MDINEEYLKQTQALFDEWKKVQTAPKQKNQTSYVQQNNVHRDYGEGVSALNRDRSREEFLAALKAQAVEKATKQTERELAKNYLENKVKEDLQPVGIQQIPGIEKYNLPKSGENLKAVLQEQEQLDKWLDPSYKLTKAEEKQAEQVAIEGLKKYRGMKLADMTPEQKSEFQKYQDLKTKTSELQSFAIGAGNKALNIVKGLGGLIARGLDSGVNQNGEIIEKNGISDKYNAWSNQIDELTAPSVQLAQNNPISYGAGQFATNAGLYAASNPLFNNIAAGLGAKGLAAFGVNQAAAAGQDLALDILPMYENLSRDGDLTNDEIKYLAKQFGWDVVFNLGLGLGGEALKKISAARAASKAAKQGIVPEPRSVSEPEVPRSEDIPLLEEDIIARENRQFAELMDDYKNEVPVNEPKVPVMEDPELANEIRAMNDELSNMWSKPAAVEEVAETAKNAAKGYDLPQELQEIVISDFSHIQRDLYEGMKTAAEATGDAKVIAKYKKLVDAVDNYEKAVWNVEDLAEVNNAKKAADAARQAFTRAMKKADPSFKVEMTGTELGRPYYRRVSVNPGMTPEKEALVQEWLDYDEATKANRYVRDAEPVKSAPENVQDIVPEKIPETPKAEIPVIKESEAPRVTEPEVKPRRKIDEDIPEIPKLSDIEGKVEGANPLQTFAEGAPKEKWATSKARTNTFENQGWGEDMPMKDYAYRVYTEAEQNADAIARAQTFDDLIHKEDFDSVDVKATMNEIQSILDSGDPKKANRLARKLAFEGREGGRKVQAFAEYNRNTASGALTDAARVQEDTVLQPWKSRNKKQAAGNSRIAKALADMGNKWKGTKSGTILTHDQVKKGVISELEKEVGSVEKYFNDNDIEFLTQLAEDKSIPVWKITSEIEHKLKNGTWYSLDESTPIPQPTNKKLQSAFNSLVTEQVRTEKPAPSLKEITEEVRNTLGKESAEFEDKFNDDDIDYIANLINNGATREELTEALNLKLATGSFGISDETLQQVNGIFKEISQFDPNSKQFVEGQAEAYRLLANEIVPNATPLEKFEAWRYMAMLGNPKTMLRNTIGNKMFNVVTGISNNISAVAEAGTNEVAKGLKGGTNKSYDYLVKTVGGNADIFSKLNTDAIQRTKAVLNPIEDSGLIKAAAEDADASRYRQIIGSKYEKSNKDMLRQSKSVFNSKLLKLYEKITDAGISDYSAVKKKFSTSLAGYLKANGYNTDIFNAERELARLKNLSETRLLTSAENAQIKQLIEDVAQLNKARDYALKQAEYATFHEDNAVADALNRASRFLRGSQNKILNLGGYMLEGVVPFKKTPANVLRSGIEYSPLGAIDSIKKTGKLIYENTGKRAGNLADTYINFRGKEVQKTLANEVIESWSKSLTGSGLAALGFYLYNKGILNNSDKDTKYQDALEGLQNYSLTIGDKTYTVDWAAPAVMPLLLGAEISKVFNAEGKDTEEWYEHLDEYFNAANRIADPIIETSMLSGVKDTLETAANSAKYDENLNIPTLVGYNTLTGYLTQAIPTASGQVARTIDNTRRSTYTDKEGVAGTLEKQGKKLMNKIPGLSSMNEPYVDTYGREQTNSPFDNPIANLGYQMASPGYLATINQTDADAMSREAFEVARNANTLPKWQSYFKDSEGNRVSPEDYTTASKAYGQANYDIRDALTKEEWYNDLDPTQKEEIVKGINTLAEHVGKSSIDPEYETSSAAYGAYEEGGIPGLMDYYKNQIDKATLKEMSGGAVTTSSNAGKEALELISQGKTEEAQKLVDDSMKAYEIIKKAGISTNSNAAKEINAAVSAGNIRKANQIAKEAQKEKEAKAKAEETKETLSSYGLDKTAPSKTYEKAKQEIPRLTTQQFANTYKKIDADGNQGIKQDEIIDYLNKNNVSESEGKKIWSAYGNSTWKKIPVLENGTWKKK